MIFVPSTPKLTTSWSSLLLQHRAFIMCIFLLLDLNSSHSMAAASQSSSLRSSETTTSSSESPPKSKSSQATTPAVNGSSMGSTKKLDISEDPSIFLENIKLDAADQFESILLTMELHWGLAEMERYKNLRGYYPIRAHAGRHYWATVADANANRNEINSTDVTATSSKLIRRGASALMAMDTFALMHKVLPAWNSFKPT